MLTIEDTILIIVDAQGRLARVVAESETAIEAFMHPRERGKAARGSNPCSQRKPPKKLGTPSQKLQACCQSRQICRSMSFSIWGDQAVRQAVQALSRKQMLLCGFEAHICLYQSAMDLLAQGFEVYLVTDAVSSRRLSDKSTALAELLACGVHLTTVEMALFTLMRDAQHPAFKPVSALIK